MITYILFYFNNNFIKIYSITLIILCNFQCTIQFLTLEVEQSENFLLIPLTSSNL